MVAVSPKVKKWIDEGKDPGSAHWQAALDKVLDLFLPDLEKGKTIPVRGMEDRGEAPGPSHAPECQKGVNAWLN